MKKILIVGAGGFGREVYGWTTNSQENYADWKLVGFIDDNLSALDGYNYDVSIVSTISDYQPKIDEYLVMALGNPKSKSKIVDLLESKGARFETFIHKTAFVGKGVKIGTGVVMCPHSTITCDASIGDFVTFNVYSGAGHDTKIASYSTLSAHVDITGFVKIGKRVIIGSHACILPGVSVGDDAVVGAGSVVVKNVKEGQTVFGNPAKAIL